MQWKSSLLLDAQSLAPGYSCESFKLLCMSPIHSQLLWPWSVCPVELAPAQLLTTSIRASSSKLPHLYTLTGFKQKLSAGPPTESLLCWHTISGLYSILCRDFIHISFTWPPRSPCLSPSQLATVVWQLSFEILCPSALGKLSTLEMGRSSWKAGGEGIISNQRS